jgi:sugar O-acyltransferase (sialic acid O-acetyltransferase NeuD family)
MKGSKEIVLIGYSGHAFVAAEVILKAGYQLAGYLDNHEKLLNPYQLPYLGCEKNEAVFENLGEYDYFPAVGNNIIRRKIYTLINERGYTFIVAIHPRANISSLIKIGSGTLICQGANINPLVKIGKSVIVNTGAVVEHECILGDFSHIAPGAVLAGNVTVGENTFIGANAIVKQGINVGKNVIVGAGAVVLHDLPDNKTYIGNPAKELIK